MSVFSIELAKQAQQSARNSSIFNIVSFSVSCDFGHVSREIMTWPINSSYLSNEYIYIEIPYTAFLHRISHYFKLKDHLKLFTRTLDILQCELIINLKSANPSPVLTGYIIALCKKWPLNLKFLTLSLHCMQKEDASLVSCQERLFRERSWLSGFQGRDITKLVCQFLLKSLTWIFYIIGRQYAEFFPLINCLNLTGC